MKIEKVETTYHMQLKASEYDFLEVVQDMEGHQTEIAAAIDNIIIDLIGPTVFYVDVNAGEFLEKMLQIRWQFVQTDAVNR